MINRNISGCFEKYYQNFWEFWKIKKKISEDLGSYAGEFIDVFHKLLRNISLNFEKYF